VPFRASDFSEGAQEFLFACAFWVVAADERLRSAEHAWLHKQFGSEVGEKLLASFTSLEGATFFAVFDELSSHLTEFEKRRIHSGLKDWLGSCIEADGEASPRERETVFRVLKMAGVGRGSVTAKSDVAMPEPHGAVANAGQNAPAGQGIRLMQGHAGEVTALAVRQDGQYIVSGGADGMLALWRTDDAKPFRTVMADEMGVMDVAFLPDGGRVVACGRLGSIVCWDLGTGELLWADVEKRSGGVSSLDVDKAGEHVLTATEIGTLVSRSVADGTVRARFGIQGCGPLRCIRYSPDGCEMATAGDDRLIRVWNAQNGEELLCLDGHAEGVLCVAYSPDGSRLVSGSRDSTVRIWDRATGACLHVLRRHTFNVAGVDFDGDGKTVVSASWDHAVFLWNVAEGRMFHSFEFPGVRATCVAFVPGRSALVVGCSDRSLRFLPVPEE
jgi:WD40 repeat protein